MISTKRMRRLLVERDTNFHRLAEETGLSSETMYRIKTGGEFRMDTVDRICAFLKCQPCDMMEHVEEDVE